MSGMGLADFLGNNPSSGSGRRGQFLDWKKKGEVVIWLHTLSRIYYAYTHQFMFEDEYEDKETGRTKPTLRFPRFVSPEPEEVLRSQYFRDKATDRLDHMPNLDPFLLLREWIRVQVRTGALAPDTVVFEWFDPKNNKVIQWRAIDLSGLQKRGKMQWNHSIDAKLQYTMLVVDDSNLGAGVQIAQETSAVGDGMREEIKRQVESRGDEEGNPELMPYAFKWRFDDKVKNPSDMYSVFRYDKAVYTNEIYNLIAQTEAPDVSRLVTPQPGDAEKVLASFQRAQRIDLPLDAIFSDDSNARRAVAEGRIAAGGRAQQQARGTTSSSVPSTPGGARQAARPPGGAAAAPQQGHHGANTGPRANPAAQTGGRPHGAPMGQQQASTPAPSGPQTRRRRVDPTPEPEPEPVVPAEVEVEMIACDDCGTLMLPTQDTCPKCGATYDIDPDASAPAPTPVNRPAGARPPGGAPQGGARPSGGGAAARPATQQPAAQAQQRHEPDQGREAFDGSGLSCWSCGSSSVDAHSGKCNDCGMTQNDPGGDDIPF